MQFQGIVTLLVVILVDKSSATIESSQVIANPTSSSSYPFAISLFNCFWNGYEVQDDSWDNYAVYSGLANFKAQPYTYSNVMDLYFQSSYSAYPVCYVQFESAVVVANIHTNRDYITIKVYNPDGSEISWYNISSWIHIMCFGSMMDPYVYNTIAPTTSGIGPVARSNRHLKVAVKNKNK
jgi:hypothetical protein